VQRHTRNFYLPWSSLDERQQEHVREESASARPRHPAPPQPGREEIAEHLYTKFCADPSIEWQDASEKLKDVWRRYAGEIAR